MSTESVLLSTKNYFRKSSFLNQISNKKIELDTKQSETDSHQHLWTSNMGFNMGIQGALSPDLLANESEIKFGDERISRLFISSFIRGTFLGASIFKDLNLKCNCLILLLIRQ